MVAWPTSETQSELNGKNDSHVLFETSSFFFPLQTPTSPFASFTESASTMNYVHLLCIIEQYVAVCISLCSHEVNSNYTRDSRSQTTGTSGNVN